MTLGNGNNLCNFSCNDIIIKNSLSEKILGLTIDHNLEFSDNISNICKTANQKLNALFRVSAKMNSYNFFKIMISRYLKILKTNFSKHVKYKGIFYNFFLNFLN